MECSLILGSSIFLYKYGKVFDNIIKDFPDIKYYKTSLAVDGDDLAKMPKTVGLGVVEITTLLQVIKPDAVLTIADRFETLATSIAASYLNIPLIHMQGGEVSGTIDDKVRNANTMLADYHFPAAEYAKDRIIEMVGSKAVGRTFAYGCPSMDLLTSNGDIKLHRQLRRNGKIQAKFNSRSHLNEKLSQAINTHGTGDLINFSSRYMIVMLHPDTVYPFSDRELGEFTKFITNSPVQKVIFWNNIDPGGEQIAKAWRIEGGNTFGSKARYIRHIEPEIFGILLDLSSCIIGNSSAGIREATYMGTPSITVGRRQEGRISGDNLTRCTMNIEEFAEALEMQMVFNYRPSDMYGDGRSGLRIAQKIQEILYERQEGLE